MGRKSRCREEKRPGVKEVRKKYSTLEEEEGFEVGDLWQEKQL